MSYLLRPLFGWLDWECRVSHQLRRGAVWLKMDHDIQPRTALAEMDLRHAALGEVAGNYLNSDNLVAYIVIVE